MHLPPLTPLVVSVGLLLTAGASYSGPRPMAEQGQSSPSICSPNPPSGNSGSDAELRKQIASQVAQAWKESNFAWLDSTADEYVRTRAKTYSGKWRLSIFYSTLSCQLKIDPPDDWYLPDPEVCRCRIPNPKYYEEADGRWGAVRTKLDQWLAQAPQSVHTKIALAQMFVNRAWFYRGTGYASTVPQEAWPVVSRYLEESRKTLTARPEIRFSDPEWFDIMFFLAAAQSWQEAQIEALIKDFRKSGQSYITAYQSAASMMLPKWGGSYEALERFAQQVVVDGGDDGFEAYARIYWNTVDALTFSESRAHWPTMKRGFEIMIHKYPDSRNVNGLAMYACAAGDGNTFREAMRRLGENLNPEAWTIPVDYCKAKYETSRH